jgi:surface antigen
MKRLTILLLVTVSVVCGYVPAKAQPMAGADQQVITTNIQSTLEYNKTDQAAVWTNPDTGNSGTTVPVRTFTNAGGQPCREFVSTIVIAGEEQQGYGTACRQPDGTWQIASGQDQVAVVAAAEPPVVKSIYLYNEPRPYGYYPYGNYGYYPYGYYGNYAPWYGWYPAFWPYPVSFSFGFSHHKSHSHHYFSGHSGHSFKSAGFRGQGFSGGHNFRSGGSGFRSGGNWSGGQGVRSGGGGFRSGGGGGRR